MVVSAPPGLRARAALPIALLLATAMLSGCSGPGFFHDPGGNGQWAKEFLSAKDYRSLLVEIDHESGAGPESLTTNSLRSNLETLLNKPDGVDIRTAADVTGDGQGAKYSFAKVRSIEEDVRDHYKGGNEAVLHVLFLNGGSSEDSGDSRVLGAAYSGSSIVMFKDNIRAAKDSCFSVFGIGCPTVAQIEEAVMVHELGHILGLVNNGIPMVSPHEDGGSEGHSDNPDSVMYWKVETGDIIDFFTNGNQIPNKFDADDRADMKNAGGK